MVMKRIVCGDIYAREVENYILKLPLEQSQIAGELRSLILSASPHMEEQIKWGKPWFGCGEFVCYIAGQSDYVNLGFANGAELDDPEQLLQGTGKGMRHIKVRTLKGIRRKPFLALIKQSVKLNGAATIKKPREVARRKAAVKE
jgi:hypothetical protein